MSVVTPDWVKNAVFYQIFPDRFARSERISHPRGIQFKEWGSDPAEQGYQGGDLYGVVDHLDYLRDLGITAIYLNPIFSSASNHRYHTFDYYEVDPLLGGNDVLRELLDEAHKRDMRVVLDGVFNHASRGFWQFHHILENGGNSPYIDWFIIHDFPLNPYSDDPKKRPYNYAAWWDLPALPKLNTDNPGVRDMIYDIARHWLEFGIDGWRLDVPAEIDDDAFWQGFRKVVKETNPEAYIVGEIWEEAQRWLQGDQFDAVMNYIFAWSSICFFGGRNLRKGWKRQHSETDPLDAKEFANTIDDMHALYDWNVNQVQLNLLDSHDTERVLYAMSDDQNALELCLLHQMTMPGAPCIYYGTELGYNGANDPHCREAFLWERVAADETGLIAYIKQVTRLRHENPVLRTGDFEVIYAKGDVLAFVRTLDGVTAVVVYNVGEEDQRVELPVSGADGQALQSAFPAVGQSVTVDGGVLSVDIAARTGMVFIG